MGKSQKTQKNERVEPPRLDLSGLEVVYRKLDELKPHPRNPRIHSEESIRHQIELIRRYGWTVPVLIDEDDVILAGHKRRLAAERLRLDRIPTVCRAGFTDEEKLAYVIADNQSTFRSPWDEPLLGHAVADLGVSGFELPLLGFEDDRIQTYMSTPRDGEIVDLSGEWLGMPEFSLEDKQAFRSLIVHFPDQAAVEAFQKLIGRELLERTKMIWFPEIDRDIAADKRYRDES